MTTTLKVLTQNLAMSENALRKSQDGSAANVRGVVHGRAAQLEELQHAYPDFYKSYVVELDERLNKPYDFAAIKNSIAGGAVNGV